VKLNKKMRQQAIFTVLSRRLKDNEIKFIDSLDITEPKTKALVGALERILSSKRLNALIVTGGKAEKINRASRNLKEIKSIDPKNLNIYDLLKPKTILIEKEALPIIETHYHAAK